MGKVQRRAKGGAAGERKQRRHTAQPRLNRAQRKFKQKQSVGQQQNIVNDGTGSENDDDNHGILDGIGTTTKLAKAMPQTQPQHINSDDEKGTDDNAKTEAAAKPKVPWSNRQLSASTDDHRRVGSDGQRKQRGAAGGTGAARGDAYLSAYKRAQLTYERLQAEKRAQRQRAREEREREDAERAQNTRWRRKKNQALQLRTAKGQPNLNAQIGILLEQIERKACQ
ncbi:hypothetical protein niasHS_000986 [Heterodera schachtii]|uniref:Uncharacterized protein n=1 Tax=Heterodera schachtii TaxID=97005 RepID=A0ABD2K820_HETSC